MESDEHGLANGEVSGRRIVHRPLLPSRGGAAADLVVEGDALEWVWEHSVDLETWAPVEGVPATGLQSIQVRFGDFGPSAYFRLRARASNP